MKLAERLAIFERDDYTCAYCRKQCETHSWYEDDIPSWCGGPRWRPLLNVDHRIPKSRGGTDDLDNLTTACVECNLSKYNKTPLEFLCGFPAGTMQ